MPRTVRLSAAVSLDGFIAGPEGEIDWITMDPDIDFNMFDVYDTVLMGRLSFEDYRRNGGGNGWPGKKTFVFSRTMDPVRGVTVTDDLEGTVRMLREGDGKDIWLFGGGVLFRSLLDLNMVDEIQLAVIPVLLGGGLPLLPEPDRVNLRLTSHRLYEKTGTLMLEYEVVR